MDVKDASKAVIELMKLEKALEPTCNDCENCKVLKTVKDEIINLSAFIVYEQARRILTLTRAALGDKDPDVDQAIDRLEGLIKKKTEESGGGGSGTPPPTGNKSGLN